MMNTHSLELVDKLLASAAFRDTQDVRLIKELESLGIVCAEALIWFKTQPDGHTAWRTCERPEWMLWLCGRVVGLPGWPTRAACVAVILRIAQDCIDAVHSMDKLSAIQCVNTATSYVLGTATLADLEATRLAVTRNLRDYNQFVCAHAINEASKAAAKVRESDDPHGFGLSLGAVSMFVASISRRKRREVCDLIRSYITIPKDI